MPSADNPRRSERSRAAILQATQELIREQPYAKISIEGIAARAKVGKQTIYRWWRSKGALVVDALHEQNAAGAQQTMALPDTGNLAADMRLVLRATVDEFTSPDFEPLFRALAIESLQDPALQEQIVERIYRPQFEFVAARFRSAQEAGQVRPDVDLALAFELFMAPLFYRWQSGAHPLTHDQADAVVDLAMRALAP
ncbi:TetR/AcrR family transcriptional regulator [Rhodococcus opacus]|uniref:TetR/AcrR family transcriptional regulator n=1 Tax=Rhodococcus opacus TaxID=37919 RepID=A0AAX3YKM0_RHOOP|nr:TetR/AcrR family transcriptional regulator [Rhodococcus opacus]MCZ4585194.1 TetR/AcrR family transcriptional regulator [Rhodococcus opacus]WLF48532.1 TetR/AcrR family transcriptional regulator [Rhodococcus opacus]